MTSNGFDSTGREEGDGRSEEVSVGDPMDPEFYNGVDSFLTRPAPAIPGDGAAVLGPLLLGEKKKKKKTKSSVSGAPVVSATAAPKAKTQMEPKTVVSAAAMAKTKAQYTKVRSSGYGKTQRSTGSDSNLNPELLEEAFMYADWIANAQQRAEVTAAMQSFEEEPVPEDPLSRRPRQEPNPPRRRVDVPSSSSATSSVYRSDAGRRPANSSSLPSSHKVGMIRSLKSKKSGGSSGTKKQQDPRRGGGSGAGFSVSAEPTDNSLMSKVNPTDYSALLRNFTEGTTLHQLRRELAESQASMEQSKSAILDIAGMR